MARIAVTTSTISIHRWFIGYIVTGISEFVFVYAFAKTAVIKFDILLYSYVTFTLPSATSYNVPSMYLNYPGTVTGLNYVSGTQVAIIIEAPYITVGLPCSIDFALAANNVNTSTTPATIPSISSIPTLINVASIDGGNAASFTSYPLTITPYTQCTSTFELIVLTTYKFELSVFNNVGSTQLTSIYCSEGSAATATMSITTAASWLTYTDSSQYFAGVVPSATTSVTATASINIASQNIVISPGITITITGTWADTNWIQCSSASACDLWNTGYKINSTNANQWICQSAIDPSSQQSSPASSSQTNTTTTTTTTATTTFAQLTQDQSSGTTGQATAGATAACLGGVAVSSTIMTTQSSTQLIFTLLGFYQMLLMMLMLNFDFPQLFIDFLKPFKIVNLNLDFMSSIPVINEVKDFFSINGMNSPDISRMQLTKNTFIYNFICAIGFIILVICLHLIVYWIYRKCKASIEVSNCKTKIAEFLKSMFYYGFYIHYLLESFMVMAICSIFTLMNVKNSSAGMIISAVSSWVYLLFIAAFICFVVYRVCKINDEAEVKGKYKALYDKIDYSKRAARHYSILYLVRRIVLVGAIMSLSNSYVQLSIFVLNQLWSIVYLIAVRPFERAVDNINIVIVELGNLICLWFVFMLPTSGSTDYSVSRTKMVGYWMMYSILASTNVPIGITYIGFIASWVKRKKRIAPVSLINNFFFIKNVEMQ